MTAAAPMTIPAISPAFPELSALSDELAPSSCSAPAVSTGTAVFSVSSVGASAAPVGASVGSAVGASVGATVSSGELNPIC